MADHNDPAIAAAVEDLGYTARNLRSANHGKLADALDRVADAIAAGDTIDVAALTSAAQDVQGIVADTRAETPGSLRDPAVDAMNADIGASIDRLNVADTAPDAAAATPAHLEADGAEHYDDEFVPVEVTLTFDARPDATTAEVRDGLDGALGLIGTYRYVADPVAGSATILVTEPGDLPLGPGAVPVAGVAHIAGQPTNVCATVPDEDGNHGTIESAFAAADASLEALNETLAEIGEVPAEAVAAFKVSYALEGGTLDTATILPVLTTAEATLSRFGELIPTEIVHGPDATIVEYSVLDTGAVSTAHLVAGTVGWGGTVQVPGVGRVTASVVTV